MRVIAALRMWFRSVFAKGRAEDEMRREMQFHVESETARLEREGVPTDEARRRALAAFGGVERFKEEVRAERLTGWLDAAGTELRIALRTLTKRPAFAAVVVGTIAIGIGATTAVFSWADWTLLRPVPGVRDPGQMVSIGFQTKPDTSGRYSPVGFSYANFKDLAPTVHAFTGMAGYAQEPVQLAVPNADPLALDANVVLGDYFRVLGVVPQKGRTFTAEELEPASTARVAIISDTVWRAAFDRRPDVLGQTIQVNGEPFTVIGIAPPDFHGTDRGGITNLWLPTAAFGVLRHQPSDMADRHFNAFMSLVGRLRPGVTPDAAAQELNRRLAILIAQYPDINGIYADHRAVVNPDLGMQAMSRTYLARTVRMTFVVVALILLIACANVANLLLLRAGWQRGDTAVRRALGAPARRVVGRCLTEGLLLAGGGGLLGLVLAFVLARVFTQTQDTVFGVPAYTHFVLDWRVLGVAVAATLVTGLVFGVVPALAALRDDPMRQLREGAERQSVRRAPARAVLTTIQVAAATTLVVGALLLSRTLYSVGQVDLGFNPQHASFFIVDTRPQAFTLAQVAQGRQALLTRASALPGVQAVALASSLPSLGAYFRLRVHVPEDTAKGAAIAASSFVVSPDFFRAFGIRLVQGASFSPQELDDTTSRNIVISEPLARRLFGSPNPVGRRIIVAGFSGAAPWTVIGVTADVRTEGPLDPPGLAVYMPAMGGPFGAFMVSTYMVVVRSNRPVGAIHDDLKRILFSTAPGVPLPAGMAITTMVNRSTRDARLFARLISVLACIAVVLAGIGLYSVIAFTVTERTREIGIRMALGATRPRVVGFVARHSATLVTIGLILGGFGAYALGRLLTSWLYGVGPLDPVSYGAAALAWVLLAALASFIPARAASRVDPTVAMRAE